MSTDESKTELDAALEQVSSERREFLKQVLGGAAAVALPLIATEAAARRPPLPLVIGKGFFAPGAAKGAPAPAPPPGPAGKGRGPRVGGKGGGRRWGRRGPRGKGGR